PISREARSMSGLNELEAAVLDKILAGDEPAFSPLREQRRRLRVSKRELTGVGFFTEFEIPPDAPRLAVAGPIRFGDVLAEIEGLTHGAGFVLFIDDGLLTMLEGYSNGNESWPGEISSFRLSYWQSQRDLSVFKKHDKP
ncbi:MAG TPA: hypothetical protein VFB81_16350, partial [Myxococcales bacterium]|nr:hypothetical protein [Myxococcales bacterium]